MRNRAMLAALTFAALAANASAADIEALTAEARAAVKGFAVALKGELKAAIEAGGPEHALGVCNSAAPMIGADSSAAYGGEVGRTSLRLRNPANAADAWELAVLEDFEARKAAGEAVAGLERAEIIGSVFRYMKAILTAELCTKCHGSDIAPEVVELLALHYPEDRARGFAVGDIRGAFTLSKTLE